MRAALGLVMLTGLATGCRDEQAAAREALAARDVKVANGSLVRAIRRDDLDLVDLLVRAGVHPSRGLRRAITANRCAALATMLAAGQPAVGSTATAALLLAAARGQTECVEALTGAGVEIDRSQRGIMNLVRRLVALGDQRALSAAARFDIPLDARDDRQQSALEALVIRGDREAAAALVAAGADLDLADRAGVTALHYALWQRDEALATLLLDSGADPAPRDRDGWDALAVAARTGMAPVARRLLAGGADPDGVTREGWTALGLAVVEGHVDVIDGLLAAGADPLGGRRPTPSPLAWAVRSCRDDLVSRLVAGRRLDPGIAAGLRRQANSCAGAAAGHALESAMGEGAS